MKKPASNALEVGTAIHEALFSGLVDASLSEELQNIQRKALADYRRISSNQLSDQCNGRH